MINLPPAEESWWPLFVQELDGSPAAVAATSPQFGDRYWCIGVLPGQDRMTTATTAYAGSVTKQFIAALTARAVLARELDPEASIRHLLPSLPAWTSPIRVQHLVHHTAALPQPPALAAALGLPTGLAGESRLNNAAVLAALSQVEPHGSPGQAFSYDNTGYVLLAEVLRAVYGVDVADTARTDVFERLGLSGSWLGGSARAVLPGLDPPPRTVGDGGLWTCAADLLRWLAAMNEGMLGADLTALVQTPGRLDDGTYLDYAWGIAPRPGPAGMTYLHGGSWAGWRAMTVRGPSTGTAVAILTATDNAAVVSAAAINLQRSLATKP